MIITSTAASNRIEGNKLSDDEVEKLYKNLRIKKFKTRDEQEVAGYLECLESIFENYNEIKITESRILGHLVKKEMQELVAWFNEANHERARHPLILIANFIFEYLAIHPFQDCLMLKGLSELVRVEEQDMRLNINKDLEYYICTL